ncbi:hypothetical protein [Luteimonas salinilitoris]|uniref:Uncharacterized protein n=1 Tax=Luteimonas salinilitoris TaxID=3237697 RepID=A0ABV4HR65_9GAMM
MNAMPARNPAPQAATPGPVATTTVRREHRTRDFGVGYGSSSGYATDRHYIGNHLVSRFRCA